MGINLFSRQYSGTVPREQCGFEIGLSHDNFSLAMTYVEGNYKTIKYVGRNCRSWLMPEIDTKCWSNSAGEAASLEKKNR